MKAVFKYLSLSLAFAFLASGVVVAAFLDSFGKVDYDILLMVIPVTILFISVVLVNDKLLVPGLLLNGRYGWYALSVFAISYLISLSAILLEYIMRRALGIPMRIHDYSSPWILADTLCNSMLLLLILFGMGMLQVYNVLKSELENERVITLELERYIRIVNDRINPRGILDGLDSVAGVMGVDSRRGVALIHDMSRSLRQQLQELPVPPSVCSDNSNSAGDSFLSDFIASPRFRITRHVLFVVILILIAAGTFFNAPDAPEFSLSRFCAFMALFAILMFLAYTNIVWLYRRFRRHQDIRRYYAGVAGLLCLIVVPMIMAQIYTYEPSVYRTNLPLLIAIVSTAGSLLTLFMFIGGLTAVLLLQDWILRRRRITLLRAETVRQEYSYLRKQINPHFLFNVLNNIGITIEDDPECASSILRDLRRLIKFQLECLSRSTISMGEELSFIHSYLALEKSRRERFDYKVVASPDIDGHLIPSLLFIPFIENAVKYSLTAGGDRIIYIRFEVKDGWLHFNCMNPFDKTCAEKLAHGGIGLGNTVRRLDLLYAGNYGLRHTADHNRYDVELEIPIENELPDS